jgi:hypothetical protein
LAKHRRRDGYWRVYHLAHTRERDGTVSDIVSLVRENRPPPRRRGTRGRRRVHSWEKLVCIAWNVGVRNRLRCTKELGMEVKPIISN